MTDCRFYGSLLTLIPRTGEQLMFSSANRNSVNWIVLAGQFEELARDLSEVHAKGLALKRATQLRAGIKLERSLFLLQSKILDQTQPADHREGNATVTDRKIAPQRRIID